MKINKKLLAMNLAAVIAFSAAFTLFAPADVVSVSAATGDPATEEANSKKAGEEVKFDEETSKKYEAEGLKFEYNGDGATITLSAVSKEAKSLTIPGTVKNAAGKEVKVTQLKKGIFNGVTATTIDLSQVELEKLVSKQFDGAKKCKTLKLNAKNLKSKNISKSFAKGLKKCKKIKVKCTKKQFKKIQSKLNTAAKKTGYKKGTKVKRES